MAGFTRRGGRGSSWAMRCKTSWRSSPENAGAQGQELVERGPQRIHITRFVEHPPLAQGLFRAHVPQRSQHVAGHRQVGLARQPRQAEIGHPEVAGAIDEQVGRLDVAVQDAVLVGVLQRVGSLDSEMGDGADEALTPGRGAIGFVSALDHTGGRVIGCR